MSKHVFVIVLLILSLCSNPAQGQANYNACNNALELCPNQVFGITNIDANKTFCPGCEDDFNFCFAPNNSIWLTFITNASGGDVSVDLSNLLFEINPGQGTELQATLISATVPCNAASFSQIGNCVSAGTSDFSLIAAGLLPSTVYYVVISGSDTGAGVTSAAECTFDVSISGTAVDRPVPSVGISVSSSTICVNDILTATALPTDCPETSSYKWFVNGVLAAETVDPVFQTTTLVHGAVIRVETACFSLCPVTVSENSVPLTVISFPVDAGSDLFIDFGDTVQLNGTTSSADFIWSPEFGVSNSTTLSPFIWPTETTAYTLTATENGCSLSDQVVVHVESQLLFPNTFSPNEDEINDTWVISGIELYPDCYVRIYDRWGQEVFQSTGYSIEKSWDGNARSGKMSEGVYFYVVDLRDDDKQQFKGSITLIR